MNKEEKMLFENRISEEDKEPAKSETFDSIQKLRMEVDTSRISKMIDQLVMNLIEQIVHKGKEFLTTSEAAILLRKFTKSGKPSSGAIRNMVWRGKIPFYKPFGRLLFKRSDFEQIIEASRNGGYNVC